MSGKKRKKLPRTARPGHLAGVRTLSVLVLILAVLTLTVLILAVLTLTVLVLAVLLILLVSVLVLVVLILIVLVILVGHCFSSYGAGLRKYPAFRRTDILLRRRGIIQESCGNIISDRT